MSTLVTLGCSFTQGQGCYKESSLDENSQEYYKEQLPNFLKGCIGSNIQKEFGFANFYNYAQGGDSNLTQLLRFFNNPIQDDDTTILWQVTFPTRGFMVIENTINTLPFEFTEKMFKVRLEFGNTSPEDDMRREVALYLKVMKEYCRVRGWKFFVWFWENGEYSKYSEMFPLLKENIIPFNKEPFDDDMYSIEFGKKGHPNEKGYKKISDTLIRAIESYGLDFPHPNETPKVMKFIDNPSI